MSGWSYSTKVLPGGTETAYRAYTADIFPTWAALFKAATPGQEIFAQVHPEKNAREVMGKLDTPAGRAR